MNVLLVNCSPVRNGATAEIIKIIHSFLNEEHDIRSICIDDYDIKFCKGCNRIIESIEHFYGHLEIAPSGSLGLCSIEYKEALASKKDEIKEFCSRILMKCDS